MLVELSHYTHPYDGEPKKVLDSFHLQDIVDLTYKVIQVDDKYCNLIFILNKNDKELFYPVEVESNDMNQLIEDAREIFDKLLSRLDDERSDGEIKKVTIDYTQNKLNLVHRFA